MPQKIIKDPEVRYPVYKTMKRNGKYVLTMEIEIGKYDTQEEAMKEIMKIDEKGEYEWQR